MSSSHVVSESLQHPPAKHWLMDEAQDYPPDCPPDRFWLIYENICRYCDRMWANIASMRSRAMEHIVFTATILGLYLGLDASSEYQIGWWGFAGILCLLAFTLPHLMLTINLTDVDEFYLGPEHAGRPEGEPEEKILDALNKTAAIMYRESSLISKQYRIARSSFWLVGFPLEVALAVIDWIL